MEAGKKPRKRFRTAAERLARAREVADVVRQRGSQAKAGAQLGISNQMVCQILQYLPATERAALPSGRKSPAAAKPRLRTKRKPLAPADAELRRKLEEHLPLVKKVALVLSQERGGHPAEDFWADGCVGLLQALRKFDPERHTKFATYAWPRISGAIRDGWRREDELGRVRRRQLNLAMERAEELAQHWGRVPTCDELLEVCADLDRYVVGLAADRLVFAHLSLDVPLGRVGEKATRRRNLVADPKARRADATTLSAVLVERLFAGLSQRERVLLYLHYFQGHTFVFIAEALRVSESRCSQMHTDVMVQLRRKFTPEELWPLVQREE